jgi:hypothetical protein
MIESLESVYESIFSMKRHEISAFRRMRTISQLLNETLSQIIIQAMMLYYMQTLPGGLLGFEVTPSAIIASVALAVVHMLIEWF